LWAAQPFGLETSVGDNGALFSGGQRQRLGLARAILRGARLLLLDEATSALDEENERQVLENLSASGKAVLLVTHRALTRIFGHRVFQLQEGCLIEESPRMMSGDEQANDCWHRMLDQLGDIACRIGMRRNVFQDYSSPILFCYSLYKESLS